MRDIVRPSLVATTLMVSLACGKAAESPRADTPTRAAVPTVAAPGDSNCPATGLWAECSVMYRLDRAGIAPKLDSTATPEEKSLAGRPMVIKVGSTARLEVFLYPDSTTRVADGKKLDRTTLVGATAEQTIKRERTLIESANLLGLLTSINAHQRERVSDALVAGPPQPQLSTPKKS